jgi:hypothetical protein
MVMSDQDPALVGRLQELFIVRGSAKADRASRGRLVTLSLEEESDLLADIAVEIECRHVGYAEFAAIRSSMTTL